MAGVDEAAEGSWRANGHVKYDPDSPEAGFVAGTVISPQRVGTARSEQEAADELERFVQSSCTDAALDSADDHDVCKPLALSTLSSSAFRRRLFCTTMLAVQKHKYVGKSYAKNFVFMRRELQNFSHT